MLSDKSKQGNNNGTIVLFLLMAVFMGISFFLNDPAKEKITQDKVAEEQAADSSLQANTDKSTMFETENTDSAVISEQAREKYGIFATALSNDEKHIEIETPLAVYSFNSIGGYIEQVTLKEYTSYAPETEDRQLVKFFKDGSNAINFELPEGISTYNTMDLPFAVNSNFQTNLEAGDATTITFSVKGSNGETIEQTYVLNGDNYYIDYQVNIKGFSSLPNTITALWNSDFNSQEKGLDNERKYAAIYWRDKEESETDDIGENVISDSENEFDGPADWIAHKQQFFTSALVYEEGFKVNQLTMHSLEDDTTQMMNMKSGFTLGASNNGAFYQMKMYHGPNEFDALNSADIDLEEVIPYTWGIFGIFNKYFTHNILSLLTKFISNYGLIIIIIAFCVKLLVSPFTYKTYLSSLKMKVLKPELAALKEKYKDDSQALQVEQMKFYRQAGVNPLGGCIPLLFQMPILFAMFRFFPSAIEMRGQSFLWADDLASYDAIITWTADIPVINWIFDSHLSLFTILMSITTLVTTRMSSNQMPDQGNPAMAQQMKIMQIAMPLIFIPVFNGFAAALSCYYFVMNVLTIVQQFLMKRFLIDEDKIHAKIQLKQSQPRKKSKFQRKLDEIMEQQEAAKKNKK